MRLARLGSTPWREASVHAWLVCAALDWAPELIEGGLETADGSVASRVSAAASGTCGGGGASSHAVVVPFVLARSVAARALTFAEGSDPKGASAAASVATSA